MDIGIFIFATDTTLDPIRLGVEAEQRGFESIFLPEHSHIPTSLASNPRLPEHYWHTHDAIVALTAMAATTERIRLGTGITLVAQHDPIWLAKQLASLDVISGGRVEFGVGFGWNVEEMAHHGVDPRTRRRLVAEKVHLMRALWTEEEASFEGEFVHLESSWAWPKPVQRPHPPIVLGAAVGPKNFDALFDFATGWIPFGRTFEDDHDAFLRECDRRGEDPARFEVSVWSPDRDPGTLDALRGRGVRRAVFGIRAGDPADVLAEMDAVAALLGD